MVAAAAIGVEPFNPGNQFDDLQLFDLVIEPADFRFIQLNLSPLGGLGVGHAFDDLNYFDTGCDSFLLKLKVGLVRRFTSLGGILEDAVFAAIAGAAVRAAFAIAAAGGRGHWGRGCGFGGNVWP
jgi:hypothetical protein